MHAAECESCPPPTPTRGVLADRCGALAASMERHGASSIPGALWGTSSVHRVCKALRDGEHGPYMRWASSSIYYFRIQTSMINLEKQSNDLHIIVTVDFNSGKKQGMGSERKTQAAFVLVLNWTGLMDICFIIASKLVSTSTIFVYQIT